MEKKVNNQRAYLSIYHFCIHLKYVCPLFISLVIRANILHTWMGISLTSVFLALLLSQWAQRLLERTCLLNKHLFSPWNRIYKFLRWSKNKLGVACHPNDMSFTHVSLEKQLVCLKDASHCLAWKPDTFIQGYEPSSVLCENRYFLDYFVIALMVGYTLNAVITEL